MTPDALIESLRIRGEESAAQCVEALAAEVSLWKKAHAGLVQFRLKDQAAYDRDRLALRHAEMIRNEQESEIARLRAELERAGRGGIR